MNNFNNKTINYLMNKYNLEVSGEELSEFFDEITTISNRVPRKERMKRDLLGFSGTNALQERILAYNTVVNNVCRKLNYDVSDEFLIPSDAKFVGYKTSNGSVIKDLTLDTFPDITNDLILVFQYRTILTVNTVRNISRLGYATKDVAAGFLRGDPIMVAQQVRKTIKTRKAEERNSEVEEAKEKIVSARKQLEEAEQFLETVRLQDEKTVAKVNARLRAKIQAKQKA